MHIGRLRLQEPRLWPKRSIGTLKSSPGNIITSRRRRRRLVHLLSIASDVLQKVSLLVGLCLRADFGVGLVCVHKLNASCDECCKQKMKCEYAGKTSIGVGSGMGAGLPTKGWPVVMVPSPKCESLEV